MYIQSGEWVIISKVKRQFRFKDRVLKNMRFRLIVCVMLAGLLPCLAALFGVVKFYESRAVELRTAEIQNQCTILSNQLNIYGYLDDSSSEVINAGLTQLTNIYNGRVMIIDQDLKVIKDTYGLDEGKTDVSENVIRCMRGERTSFYDKKNHYIEVTSPITQAGSDKPAGVILASVSTDSIEVTRQVLYTHGSVVVVILMILLAAFSVFLADRMVRPLRRITGGIENVTEGYSDDVLHVDTFTETKQSARHSTRCLAVLRSLMSQERSSSPTCHMN